MQPLEITGYLDAYAAEQVRQTLLDYLRAASAPELDLAGVKACDAVGIQLLCAARRSAEVDGKRLAMRHISEPLRTVCAALGVTVEQLSGGVS
jgi:anti-anti-sigma regulatory factor